MVEAPPGTRPRRSCRNTPKSALTLTTIPAMRPVSGIMS
nr:MAG TPA: hypothetical protein [Caudoviricetes sp.]